MRFFRPVKKACEDLGHTPVWWNGPCCGTVYDPEPPKDIHFAVIWNGLLEPYAKHLTEWRFRGIPCMIAELGWYPHDWAFQVDWKGVNAAASWADEPIVAAHHTPVPIHNHNEVLVLLQYDEDTQITRFSPWFKTMEEFVRFLAETVPQKLVVRRHPHFEFPPEVGKLFGEKVRPDDAEDLADALDRYDLVACINSSGGVEAIQRGKLVFCFGLAVYRWNGVVVCLDNDRARTTQAFLNSQEAPVWIEPMRAMMSRIARKQWPVDQVTDRMTEALGSVRNGY